MQQRDLLALPTAIHVMRLPDGKHRQQVVAQGGWPAWGEDDSTLLFHRLVRGGEEGGHGAGEGAQQGGAEGWFSVLQVRLDVPGDEGQGGQGGGKHVDGWSGATSKAETSAGDGEASIGVGKEERLTPSGLHALTPSSAAPSPCGPFIALTTRRPPSPFRHVELLHLPSRQLYMLTQHINPSANHYSPSVAPDGSRVAYHRCRCAAARDALGNEGVGSSEGEAAELRRQEPQAAVLEARPLTLQPTCRDCEGYYVESMATPLPPSAPLSLIRVAGLFPALSPDGRLLAFILALSGAQAGVYVVPADGSAVQRCVFKGPAFGLAWSPAVPGVLYTSAGQGFAPEAAEVHVVEVSGVGAWLFGDGQKGEGKAQAQAEGGAGGPGKEEGSGDSSTGCGGAGGVAWRYLTLPGMRNNAFPAPSPCGRWLVFRSARTGHKNLFLMGAQQGERGGVWQVSEGAWTDTMAAWDPWGRWIVFSSDRDKSKGFALYAMPVVLPPHSAASPAAAAAVAAGVGGAVSKFETGATGVGDGASNGQEEKRQGTAGQQQQGVVCLWHNGPWGRVNHAAFSPDGRFLVVTADVAGMSADPTAYPQQFQPYGEIFLLELNRTDHPPQPAAAAAAAAAAAVSSNSSDSDNDSVRNSSSDHGSEVGKDGSAGQLSVRRWERLTFNPYEDGTPSWSHHMVHPAPLHTQRHRVTCDFDDVGALGGGVGV
ncbi:hypothetical protein CLOM_g15529 [Closterium sp. NIES-68]|nr:hypothetical protein CLOM_g15529 [Closterium sp. NIES-68]GJP59032.1 hypothetical protein CLOP_g7089 [Closterium sp. NIES-67]